MVFHTVSDNETLQPPSMASTVSSKSQPRHNFPLSNLKWQMNNSNTQRFRTHLSPSTSAENRSASPLRSDHHLSSSNHGDLGQSRGPRPASPSADRNEHRHVKCSLSTLNSSVSGNSKHGDRNHRMNDGMKCGISKENLIEKEEKSTDTAPIEGSEKKLAGTTRSVEEKELKFSGSDGKPRIFIRIPARTKAAVEPVDENQCAVDDDEPMAKPWNLRPRRAATKPANASGCPPENKPRPQSQPKLAAARAAPAEKVSQKKQRFSISLSKEEIEEDFLAMTGSRPPKKPKRRARIVQKQLDETFPGLWLTDVTANLYRVAAHRKG
ncbi:hypothetical protein L6164_003572 [Bauhinia variegata]|uniref:Uncharacterized protein n=1 Tax=Bauhinia variegata TaxID=167791 RepID=A0ACB9Q1Q0_BAUVA|nr:hypothetical protein L6164_003572 [Bauhinia variegata]